ncbi:uncharacterized protein LOC124371900 [Homalodisca vitripennis]|uniref:uncharacterized protein LOC124371900 n=1 Tax=Homalodisca vitripennis TaxID=197043 RepID=UPI001EECCB55|nr:uncharacterized protein LOC124371900 [Homalodisca vitripennis]
MESLTLENVQLKKKVAALENRVEEMEQYSRSNCVEIHGIPEEKTENVVSVVKEVGKALDMPITDSMIDACHRLGRRSGPNNQPAAIIVKFVRRLDKEELMKKRTVKKNFSTRHINMTTDSQIYINESLSPARRRLFVMAREAKKTKNFKYLWVRNGKILMRRDDGQPVIHVNMPG